MRILVATHQYHPAIGGAERYISDLTVELAARGHQIQVVTSRSTDSRTWGNTHVVRQLPSLPDGHDASLPPSGQMGGEMDIDNLPKHSSYHGVSVRRFGALRRRLPTWLLLDLGLRGYAATRNPLYQPLIFFGNGPILPELFPYILRNAAHFDLLHINHLHYAHAWIAARAAALRRLPFIITPHLHINQPETYDVAYMRNILRRSQVAIAQTAAEREHLIEMGVQNAIAGGNGLRLHDFPPLDRAKCREMFRIPQDAFVVLFLGRKVAYKGLQSCLHAFAALRQHCPHAYFLAVGPETAESRQLLQSYRQWSNVVVRGAVSDVERLAALAACDVLAVPSTGEAFGIIYLEAWAYAKPVIGAKIHAVASLIEEGVDGFLVDQARPEELLARLIQLAEQPGLARQMGKKGRAKLRRRYTMETIADIVEGAYRRVLRRRATGDHS